MNEIVIPKPPAGYEPVLSGEVDGWYKPEIGKPIRGVLLGRHYHNAKDQHYYVLQLLEKAVGHTGDGAIQLGAGAKLGVGERSDLERLREWAGSGKAEVWICPTEKRELDGGKTFWRFDLATKGPKVPASVETTKAPF